MTKIIQSISGKKSTKTNLFLLISFLVILAPQALAQPANDLICNAIPVTCGSSTPGSTIGATNSGTGEALFCGGWNQNTPGVWYSIVGNGNLITLSLCGTAHDSQIAVFTGTCAAPSCYGANDDNGPACTGLSSSFAFNSVAGVTYYIKVFSWTTFTPQFNFTLNVSCTVPPTPPANDFICNAQPVTCGSATPGSTIGATNFGAGEVNMCGNYSQNTPGVWYQIVGNGTIYTASLCGTSHDSQIAVYSGTCAAPVCISSNDDNGPACAGLASSLAWQTTAGVTYWIKVWSWSTFTPTFNFTLNMICQAGPPNDNCINATQIALPYNSGVNTNVNSTNDLPASSGGCGNTQNMNVWYTVTGNGATFQASTCNTGTAFDTEIQVFSGSCGALTYVNCADVANSASPCNSACESVTWCSVPGLVYYISIGSGNSSNCSGNFELTVNAIGISTSSVLENGDFLWRGPGPANLSTTPNTNDKWDVSSNWLVYDSINMLFNTATSLPNLTTNVFIPPVNGASGGCTFNYPRIYGTYAALCQDITILQNAKLEFVPAGTSYGSLSVSRNWMSSGQTRCMASQTAALGGTVKFVGTNNQVISNSPQTPAIAGVNNFFNFELNNTGANTGIILDFPATNYVYIANSLNMIRGNILSSSLGRLVLGSNGLTSGWSTYPSPAFPATSFFNPVQATVTWSQGSVIGPMWRYFRQSTTLNDANTLYPLGNITATTVINRNSWLKYPVGTGTAGYIRGEFFGATPPSLTGLPLTDGAVTLQTLASEGYWEFLPIAISSTATPWSATTAYSFDARVNQFTSAQADYLNTRIVKAPGQTPTTWTVNGAHAGITGSATDYRISRSGLSGFSFFAIGVPTVPLSVEFNGANLICNNNFAELFWSTASEKNSSHFVIESSTDGLNWTVEGVIDAAGNSDELSNYRFAIQNPGLTEDAYVRLSEIDIDGNASVLGTFALNCDSEKGIITYPNPSSASFNLVINDEQFTGNASVKIINAQGSQVVATRNIEVENGINSYLFDTSGLAPGMYYIQVSNGTFTSIVKHSLR